MIEINNSTDIKVNERMIRQAIETTLTSEKAYRLNYKLNSKTKANVADFFDSKELEVSVLLTDDAGIQCLNKQYRNIDKPTDVLAFAMREGAGSEINPHLLGDIVISIQTAQRQALDVQHSLDMELNLLAVHGTLHLLGYDNETDSEATIMRDKEETILRLL
jgi:probable rRNA maturation factor